ncbi:uncharacterized protein LOC121406504 [Lytechinus variegatus]|uniref:uncharacterized protein LOC121406504 n=1 Tax=Lytechinus variegatus TaxID=7654 RepID=UPI001BB2228A|nr:uncharacterized protein LOC121406504 [Lytechinus variegatus]
MSAITKWTRLIETSLQLLGIFYPRPITIKKKCDQCVMWEVRGGGLDDYDDDDASRNSHDDGRVPNVFDEDFVSPFEIHGCNGSPLPTRVHGRGRERASSQCTNDQEIGGRAQRSSRSVECEVCKSLAWDGDARPLPTSETGHGPRHRYIGSLISFFTMTILTAATLYLAWINITKYFGKKDQIMHLTSYFSFLGIIGSVPLICFYSHLVNLFNGNRCPSPSTNEFKPQLRSWPTILHQDFVMRRLQYLSNASTRSRGRSPDGTWFIVAGGVWIMIDAAFKIALGSLVEHRHGLWEFQSTLVSFLFLVFVAFCAFLFLMRRSFENEMEVDLAFIVKHKKRLDFCRGRLSETYRDFQIFNYVIHYWMLFTVNLATLGLAVHLSWNYQALHNAQTTQESITINVMNAHIFSEKIVVFILPLLALRGINLAHLWRHFRRALSSLRQSEYDLCIDGMIRHLEDLKCFGDCCGGAGNFNTLLTLAIWYYGMKIGSQDWKYYDFLGTSEIGLNTPNP